MNQIRNLTAVQKKSYAEQVGRKLGVASMETKREVQKSLMPEKFNGEGIIDVLGRQRSTTKLEAAIRLLGEDAFWSTEAQVKTMYQAVRNMTRISKLQAAGYIWKVSHARPRSARSCWRSEKSCAVILQRAVVLHRTNLSECFSAGNPSRWKSTTRSLPFAWRTPARCAACSM